MTDERTRARAKSLAFRYLALRARSRAEIREYLNKKEIPEEVVSSTLETLDGYGYLDDRRFAHDFGRHLIANKGLSRYAVRAELLRKGVPEEDVSAAFDALAGEDFEDDLTVAMRLAEKKAATLNGLDREKARRRLTDYLRRRGFSFEVIAKTLRGTRRP